ncbi:MAG: calcium/sodium antiporter [Bacteroidetes bacterium]|nr:calcium/sodium antiporter [Bacteroidota bacterium]
MLLQILLLAAGLLGVMKGADWLVESASELARKKGISELTIGLTVVAFGTSAPELAVNIQANSEIVFGNTIGSNVFNLMCILGIAGIIYPLFVQRKTVYIEIPLSVLSAVLVLFLVNDAWFGHSENILTAFDGILLLVGFALFLFYVLRNATSDIEIDQNQPARSTSIVIVFMLLGIAGLVLGGKAVVYSASSLATLAGVSDTVIALTIVSFGTSLPELATSIVAALKKRPDLAVGNVIGSNIFNLLFVLAISCFVGSKEYKTYLNSDLYVLIIASLGLFAFMFLRGKKKLDRYEAALLLVGFVGYMVFVINRELHFL